GQTVSIIGESGNWYEINYNGRTGYVSKDYIQKGGSSSSSNSTGNNSGSTNSSTSTSVTEGKVVNVSSSLNVRSEVGGPVIGSLRNGQTVSIIGESGNWYKINYNGRTGYVSKDYVQKSGASNSGSTNSSSNNTGSSNSNQTMNKQGQVYNVSSNLRVRSGASSSATVLGYLTNGQVVTITGKSGNWYKIDFNGKDGYVSSDYIRDYSVNNSGTTTDGNVSNSNAYNTILNAMKVHIGSPYVWGGSGELLTTDSLNILKKRFPTHDYSRAEAYVNKGYRAFDCSGLMQWGFAQAGIKIGRTTWDQINDGKEVSLNDLKPGDLLFYSNLQHVGMYIGNGQWIESPNSSANIRIVSVPWSKIGRARRILN
ncbi:MAG: C40 family peptidase, partial [Clostridiaceae bacterium]|nr:C40 family peptidase [Clostridiaceae bacterium]